MTKRKNVYKRRNRYLGSLKAADIIANNFRVPVELINQHALPDKNSLPFDVFPVPVRARWLAQGIHCAKVAFAQATWAGQIWMMLHKVGILGINAFRHLPIFGYMAMFYATSHPGFYKPSQRHEPTYEQYPLYSPGYNSGHVKRATQLKMEHEVAVRNPAFYGEWAIGSKMLSMRERRNVSVSAKWAMTTDVNFDNPWPWADDILPMPYWVYAVGETANRWLYYMHIANLFSNWMQVLKLNPANDEDVTLAARNMNFSFRDLILFSGGLMYSNRILKLFNIIDKEYVCTKNFPVCMFTKARYSKRTIVLRMEPFRLSSRFLTIEFQNGLEFIRLLMGSMFNEDDPERGVIATLRAEKPGLSLIRENENMFITDKHDRPWRGNPIHAIDGLPSVSMPQALAEANYAELCPKYWAFRQTWRPEDQVPPYRRKPNSNDKEVSK